MEQVILRGSVPKEFGDGYSYGYSSGYGYGSGVGYGDGYSDGSGYGYGYGYGYGSGYGDGYSDGSKEYWSKTIPHFAKKWPEVQRLRLENLRAQGAAIAFWKSDNAGRACNGGKNSPVSVGTIETAKGPLRLCNSGTLHATLIPPNWTGERWWIVALIGEVVEDEDKFGALTREIIGECT